MGGLAGEGEGDRTYTSAEVAAELGLSPESIRKYAARYGVGSKPSTCGAGSGSRLRFSAAEVETLRTRRRPYARRQPQQTRDEVAAAVGCGVDFVDAVTLRGYGEPRLLRCDRASGAAGDSEQPTPIGTRQSDGSWRYSPRDRSLIRLRHRAARRRARAGGGSRSS